jgi:uncharacterized Fe-S cluster-containing radical SAM superfamily protein
MRNVKGKRATAREEVTPITQIITKPLLRLGKIDSDRFASNLRRTLVKTEEQKVLLAQISGAKQSHDKYTLENSGGFGRTREFTSFSMHLSRVRTLAGRPIPLLRGHPRTSVVRSQVFQLAGCNWRCWYCYVDDELLGGSPSMGKYVSASELLDMYLKLSDRPPVIDLSGGQPDLVPEWTLWVLEEIDRRGLQSTVLIWQDDNLSSELLWALLTEKQIDYMARFKGHSRVGCFKGFDSLSFSYNTLAPKSMYERQFRVFERLLRQGFDVYAYATFTCPQSHCTKDRIKHFVDDLQKIHPLLPLRTIPLEVRPFSVTRVRMTPHHQQSIDEQSRAGEFWDEVLMERFSSRELQSPYEDVRIHNLR